MVIETYVGLMLGRSCSFMIAPRILHRDKDPNADCEIHQQAPVFLEKRVPHHARQVWHQQEVDRIACEHGQERVEKVPHCRLP